MEQATITFYAAECMEFEGLGKVVESADLKKVWQVYRQMAVNAFPYGLWYWLYSS